MKQTNRMLPEGILAGSIVALSAVVFLSVAVTFLVERGTISPELPTAAAVAAMAGIPGGYCAGKRAGKCRLPVGVAACGIAIVVLCLAGLLIPGQGGGGVLPGICLFLGGMIGGILSAGKGRGHIRKRR